MTMNAAILCPAVCRSDVKKLGWHVGLKHQIQFKPILFCSSVESVNQHACTPRRSNLMQKKTNFICTAIAIKTKWKRQMKMFVYFLCWQASVHLWFGSLLMIKWQNPTFDRQLISNHLLCSSQQHSAPDLCKLLFLCKEIHREKHRHTVRTTWYMVIPLKPTVKVMVLLKSLINVRGVWIQIFPLKAGTDS